MLLQSSSYQNCALWFLSPGKTGVDISHHIWQFCQGVDDIVSARLLENLSRILQASLHILFCEFLFMFQTVNIHVVAVPCHPYSPTACILSLPNPFDRVVHLYN